MMIMYIYMYNYSLENLGLIKSLESVSYCVLYSCFVFLLCFVFLFYVFYRYDSNEKS